MSAYVVEFAAACSRAETPLPAPLMLLDFPVRPVPIVCFSFFLVSVEVDDTAGVSSTTDVVETAVFEIAGVDVEEPFTLVETEDEPALDVRSITWDGKGKVEMCADGAGVIDAANEEKQNPTDAVDADVSEGATAEVKAQVAPSVNGNLAFKYICESLLFMAFGPCDVRKKYENMIRRYIKTACVLLKQNTDTFRSIISSGSFPESISSLSSLFVPRLEKEQKITDICSVRILINDHVSIVLYWSSKMNSISIHRCKFAKFGLTIWLCL